MKEYIAKDEVLKIMRNPDLGMAERIELLPIVIKADILFDFKNDISDAIDRHNVVLLNEVNAIYRKYREVVDWE